MFTTVVSSIIRSNLKTSNTKKAIGIWHDFLAEDEIMQRFYRPTNEQIKGLQLDKFLEFPETVAFSEVLKNKYGFVIDEVPIPLREEQGKLMLSSANMLIAASQNTRSHSCSQQISVRRCDSPSPRKKNPNYKILEFQESVLSFKRNKQGAAPY